MVGLARRGLVAAGLIRSAGGFDSCPCPCVNSSTHVKMKAVCAANSPRDEVACEFDL